MVAPLCQGHLRRRGSRRERYSSERRSPVPWDYLLDSRSSFEHPQDREHATPASASAGRPSSGACQAVPGGVLRVAQLHPEHRDPARHSLSGVLSFLGVAQLVGRLPREQEVEGSIPSTQTLKFHGGESQSGRGTRL
jgi:hypothetical protein